MVSSPDRPGNQKLRSDPMALVNAKAFGPWAGSSELRSASSFRPGPAPVGGACVTPAKKLVGGVSRHDRGGGCRLFKVKVSETDPKITPDQASLSTISDPGGVIQPASQHFSAVNDSGRQAHLTDQQTEKTKILKTPPDKLGHTRTEPFVSCNTHARRHDQAASLWCTKHKDAAD